MPALADDAVAELLKYANCVVLAYARDAGHCLDDDFRLFDALQSGLFLLHFEPKPDGFLDIR